MSTSDTILDLDQPTASATAAPPDAATVVGAISDAIGPVLFDQDTATTRPAWAPELTELVTDMVGFDVRLPSGWAAFVLAVPGPWMAPVALLLDAAAGRLDGTPAPDAVTAPAVLASLAPGIDHDRVTGHQMRTLLHRLLPDENRPTVIGDAWASSVGLREELDYRTHAWSSRVLRAALVVALVSTLSVVTAGVLLSPLAAVVFAVGGAAGVVAGVAAVTASRIAAEAADDPETGLHLWSVATTFCGAIGERRLLTELGDRSGATRRRHLRELRDAAASGAAGPLRDLARATRLWAVAPIAAAGLVWAVSLIVGWSLL